MIRLCVAMLLCWSSSMLLGEAVHPRLLLDAGDIPTLRERVKAEPFKSMLAAIERESAAAEQEMRARGEKLDDAGLMYDVRPRYLAQLYVLTGQKRYAVEAEKLVTAIAQSGWIGNSRIKGLSRAAGGLTMALTYDLCHDALSAEARELLSRRLYENAASMLQSMGAGANNYWANNWQGIRNSGAGIQLLASDHPEAAKRVADAYKGLIRHFRENLGDNGWNPEGIGYTGYPWMFHGAFGIAAHRAGVGDLRKDLGARITMTMWHIYAGTVPIDNMPGRRGLRADLADDNPYNAGQGTPSMAFFFAKPEHLPAFRWMFDRLHGAAGDKSWDAADGGALYGILLYPATVAAQDPAKLIGLNYTDKSHGVAIFRNSFAGEDDVVVLVNAPHRRPRGAHGGPDTNTFRVLGLGGQFVVGGGRTGKTAGQTNLFPGDPPGKGNNALGKLEALEFDKLGGGQATLSGSCMGVNDHRRLLAVDYSGRSGSPAVIVNAETSQNGRLWRLNTPEFNTINTAGNQFTLRSPNGATLTATVIQPARVTFRTGTVDRPSLSNRSLAYQGQFYAQNKYIEFDCAGSVLVVMTLQKGAAPAVRGTGDTNAAELTVGRQAVRVASGAVKFD